MVALEFKLRQEAALQTLAVGVVDPGEIEGEKLEAEQVGSSIAPHRGIDIGAQ